MQSGALYCRCTGVRDRGFTAAMLDGEPQWDFWVCSACGKPTQMVFRKLTNMYAPRNAKALLSVKGRRDGIFELRWALEDSSRVTTLEFTPYPRKMDMTAQDSLLRKTWELLDSKVNIILAEPNGPSDNAIEADNRERARNEARGIAEVLAIHMGPFMETADDVVRHAVKRHKAKAAGEEYDTPGLAEHLWDPNTNWDGTPRVPVAEPKAKPKAAPKVNNSSTKKLTQEEADGIRDAVKSGMFSEAEVASMFGVSLTAVKEAVG